MNLANRRGGHIVDLLFTLALLCVFAASSLMVVMIGANVYKGTVRGMDRNYDMRTSLSYISEKIRQNDVAGGVFVSELEGQNALVLVQDISGSVYETWIYSDAGALKELLVKQGSATREAGREIMKLQSFTAELVDGTLSLYVTASDGSTAELMQSLRSRGG